jgi:hypothetical protein
MVGEGGQHDVFEWRPGRPLRRVPVVKGHGLFAWDAATTGRLAYTVLDQPRSVSHLHAQPLGAGRAEPELAAIAGRLVPRIAPDGRRAVWYTPGGCLRPPLVIDLVTRTVSDLLSFADPQPADAGARPTGVWWSANGRWLAVGQQVARPLSAVMPLPAPGPVSPSAYDELLPPTHDVRAEVALYDRLAGLRPVARWSATGAVWSPQGLLLLLGERLLIVDPSRPAGAWKP